MPKISILGTGWGVKVQALAFKSAGWDLHAIWGRNAVKAAAAQSEFGFSSAPERWQDALEGADLVSITTPLFEHLEQTVFALKQGYNVLCEKPMAMNVAEAQRWLNSAGFNGCSKDFKQLGLILC